MPDSLFLHCPAALVAEYPALQAPASALGLLEDPVVDAAVGLADLPARLIAFFPCAHFRLRECAVQAQRPVEPLEVALRDGLARGSGIRQKGEWIEIHLPTDAGKVDSVDLLREFGCMVEALTMRLLEPRRGTIVIPVLGRDSPLQFDRRNTPGHFLETAGFKFPDHSRAYVNRHAAVLQSLAIALLTRTDPRFVFLDVLVAATDDAQMLKLLSALAFRSNIDFRDRRELEEYATLYWSLQQAPGTPYSNIHQVNEAASYYARQLRAHVRSLAV